MKVAILTAIRPYRTVAALTLMEELSSISADPKRATAVVVVPAAKTGP